MNHGILTPAERAASQELRDRAAARRQIAHRQARALWAYRHRLSWPAVLIIVCIVVAVAAAVWG